MQTYLLQMLLFALRAFAMWDFYIDVMELPPGLFYVLILNGFT